MSSDDRHTSMIGRGRGGGRRRSRGHRGRRHGTRGYPDGTTRVPAPVQGHGLPRAAGTRGYGPTDLRGAYHLPGGTAGAGQTVALGRRLRLPERRGRPRHLPDDVRVARVYHRQRLLPNADERGGTKCSKPAPKSDDWTSKIALDIDMVSTVCSQCHILVLEATTAPTVTTWGTAVNTGKLGAKYVSNSYGGVLLPRGCTHRSVADVPERHRVRGLEQQLHQNRGDRHQPRLPRHDSGRWFGHLRLVGQFTGSAWEDPSDCGIGFNAGYPMARSASSKPSRTSWYER